jgi:formylglycine-generating enzyme required for sulfatase activity
MHGNVWEWVQDWFVDYKSEAQSDPIYAQGGSWLRYARYLRAAYRYRYGPGYRLNSLGFRPARTL